VLEVGIYFNMFQSVTLCYKKVSLLGVDKCSVFPIIVIFSVCKVSCIYDITNGYAYA